MNESLNSLSKILYDWKDVVYHHLPKLFLAAIVFIVFIFVAKIARKISFAFYSRTIKKYTDAAYLISTVIYFFLILSGTIIALQVAGLEIMLKHVLAGAGVVGVVAGFAFKDIGSNFFAGLLLKIQRPYKKNDWVDIDGNYGVVLEIGSVTTKIKTVPGQEVFVPNQNVYNNTFTNYSSWRKRRIILETGVSYGDDLEHVRTVALDEVKNIKHYLPNEGVDFYYTNIGGSTYNFMLRFWVQFDSNDDYCRGMNDAIMQIKKRFEQENISIAYPVTTLDFGVKGGINIFDKPIQIKE